MRISRFEEIEAWVAARKLVNCVYEAIRLNHAFRRDFRLVNQIQGAAVSAMSNIADSKGNIKLTLNNLVKFF